MDSLTLRFWHGGSFRKINKKLVYLNGQSNSFEIDPDELCWFWLEELAKKCGTYNVIDQIFYLIPGMTLDKGLRKVYNDKEVLEMSAILVQSRSLDMYVLHGLDEPDMVEMLPSNAEYSQLNQTFATEEHIDEEAETLFDDGGEGGSTTGAPNATQGGVNDEVDPVCDEDETQGETEVEEEAEVQEEAKEQDEGDLVDSEDEDLSVNDSEVSDDEYKIAKSRVKECKNKFLELAKQLQKEAVEGKLQGQKKPPADMDCEKDGFLSEYEDSDEDIDTPPVSEEENLAESTKTKEKTSELVTSETDFAKFKWELGQRFATRSDFKNAVAKYAILQGRNLSIAVSNKKRGQRLGVKCAEGCPFKLYCSWESRRATFVLKSLKGKHTCRRNMKKNKQLKCPWVAREFLEVFKARPHWPAKEIMETVKRAYKVVISRAFAYKVKFNSHKMLHGSMHEHYQKLGRYLDALKKCSMGTEIQLVTDGSQQLSSPVFQRLFMCFEGLQRGWIDGCRRIICVDACFLKTFLGGQLISAVGRDGNDQMYPIAWAVVEGENNRSWEWFFQLLQKCLNLGEGEDICIISDEHQAILNAVCAVLPQAEHRHCARHIFALWHKRFRGDELKLMFWKIAKSYNMADYNQAFDELAELNNDTATAFKGYNPSCFCRAFMKTSFKCDAITNNMAETFNGYIINARTKHLIYMLEDIRAALMQRLVIKRQEMENAGSSICPRIEAKLEMEKAKAAYCDVLPSTLVTFQVNMNLDSLNVDLAARTCTCRRWDMSGIPCCHAIACIFFLHHEPEDYVESCYKREVYLRAYAGSIPPIEGERHWPRIECPLYPPPIKIGPGRPRVNRKKDPFEDPKKSGKLTKHGMEITCSICQTKSHNKRRCPNRDSNVVQEPQVKKARGRPRNDGKATQPSSSTTLPATHLTATAQPNRIGKRGRVIKGGRGIVGERNQVPEGYGVFIGTDGATYTNVREVQDW
ncbi:unnamed protein product [Cuscuta epithymum]|uniref:SWIM-type domain-containing protein n=1 Tax=Cuscuta epithymum TaxID=186058 RepID=A0AAV0GF65_9ASTE|nr:unnamed protein product [Cuscuta epithymum]